MPDHQEPAYALSEIQEKARAGFFHFRREALDGAAELDLDRQDIIECILALTGSNFHKSMDALNPRWSGCRQDVYRTSWCGIELYVKVQLWPQKRLFIVSFKRK